MIRIMTSVGVRDRVRVVIRVRVIQNSENNNCERHEVNDQFWKLSIAVLQPSSAKLGLAVVTSAVVNLCLEVELIGVSAFHFF